MTVESLPQAILIRMFRRWSAARDAERDRYGAMAEIYLGPGCAPLAALACGSLFDLVEAQLGRRLVPARCCSQTLACDEKALLGLLQCARPAGSTSTPSAIPHGLPGAVWWAAFAVRRELGFPLDPAASSACVERMLGCPFRVVRPSGQAGAFEV